VESRLKTYFRKVFSTPKKFGGGTSNLPQIIEDCHRSEARNFEKAQRIDTQITDISTTINALQNGIKFGELTPGGYDAA